MTNNNTFNPHNFNRSIDTAYRIVNCPAFDASHEMTLYVAAKTLGELGRNGKATDATHLRRVDRAVGFYCDFHNSVRATNFVGVRAALGARDDERELLNVWRHR